MIFENSNYMMPDSPIFRRNAKLGVTSLEEIQNARSENKHNGSVRASQTFL